MEDVPLILERYPADEKSTKNKIPDPERFSFIYEPISIWQRDFRRLVAMGARRSSLSGPFTAVQMSQTSGALGLVTYFCSHGAGAHSR